MNIAVIGTINRDTIYPYGGSKIESYGGILYNVIGLASLLKEEARIFPICNVGADIEDPVFQKLDDFLNIDKLGIRIVRQKNNHCILTYSSSGQRKEILENRVPPLIFNQIQFALDCDVILINFISGYDVSLQTLKRIRDNCRGKMYIDIHSLTLGRAEDGTRFPRRLNNWMEWVRQGDIVQLNGDEAGRLAENGLRDDDEFALFAQDAIEAGPRVILITLGSDGSIVTSEDDSGIRVERCPACDVHVIDATGCGDVFSAGFIAEYVRSEDPVTANRFANRVAGINCSLSGLEGLGKIGEIISKQCESGFSPQRHRDI